MQYQHLTSQIQILKRIEIILDQRVCRPDGGSRDHFIKCLAGRGTVEQMALLLEEELVIGWAILF